MKTKRHLTKTEILVKTSQEYAGGVKSNKEDAKGQKEWIIMSGAKKITNKKEKQKECRGLIE